MPGLVAQQHDHFVQKTGVFLLGFQSGIKVDGELIASDKGHDLAWQFVSRGHHVCHAGLQRTARHAVKLGIRGGLHKTGASSLADRAQALRAVCAHAGENDADAVFLLTVGQRLEKEINRQAQTAQLAWHQQVQHALEQRQVSPRWNNVDMIGLDQRLVLHLGHPHRGMALQQFHQHAFTLGVQMLHDHIGQAAVSRRMAKKLLQRDQPASGRANADDGKWPLGGR